MSERTGNRGRAKGRSRGQRRGQSNSVEFDYKKPEELRRYINEYGRIRPRRQTRLSAKKQRELARAIKRSRHLALLPFVSD